MKKVRHVQHGEARARRYGYRESEGCAHIRVPTMLYPYVMTRFLQLQCGATPTNIENLWHRRFAGKCGNPQTF